MEVESKVGLIEKKLKELEVAVPGVEGCALVSSDGLMLISSIPAGLPEDRVAAVLRL